MPLFDARRRHAFHCRRDDAAVRSAMLLPHVFYHIRRLMLHIAFRFFPHAATSLFAFAASPPFR